MTINEAFLFLEFLESIVLSWKLLYYFLVCKKKPVDFDDELRIGDVRYDNMI